MRHEDGGKCSMCTDCGADVLLGRNVRQLLASEEPPEGLIKAAHDRRAAWVWFREQLLGPAEAVPLPPPANIPEAGRGQRWGREDSSGREPGSLQIGGIEPDLPDKLNQAARILELEAALGEALLACKFPDPECYPVEVLATVESILEEVLRGRP